MIGDRISKAHLAMADLGRAVFGLLVVFPLETRLCRVQVLDQRMPSPGGGRAWRWRAEHPDLLGRTG